MAGIDKHEAGAEKSAQQKTAEAEAAIRATSVELSLRNRA
jgi:hypothetical protein